MQKDDLNVHVFQNRNWGSFHRKDFKWKKNGGAGLVSATGKFLHYIYSTLVDKNHQTIRSRCLAHEVSFTDTF